MMTIRTNLAASAAKAQYNGTAREMTNSFEKLSSGYRVTKASDDSAALSVGTNLTAQIQSLRQSKQNAMDGLSVLQTLEGALNESVALLTRLRELNMQYVSDGVGDTERGYIKTEAQGLLDELSRVAAATEYNGYTILDGSVNSLNFQIGIRGGSADTFEIALADVRLTSLGLDTFGANWSSRDGGRATIDMLDDALTQVADLRATFGAAQNRLSSIVSSIESSADSLYAGRSRTLDTDIAKEVSSVSSNQVLQQAGAAVITQSYQFTGQALRLLDR